VTVTRSFVRSGFAVMYNLAMLRRFTLPFAALLVTACAEGESLTGAFGGSGDVGGSDTGGAPSTSTGGAPTTTTITTGGMTVEGGFGGMGTGGMGGEPTTSVGGGTPCNFTAPEDCAGAEILPAVSGDDGGMVTRNGTTSKWWKVQISETNSSVFGENLSYRVTLASPASVNYDLRVYENGDDEPASCSVAPKAGSGNPETVQNDWDDTQGFGGEDNSRWLIIEIFHVSGTECNPEDQWTLSVQGAI
jgi:hypothetical protein